MAPLPSHVHISKHPALLAKLSQLRSRSSKSADVKTLIHEIALILSCEALATSITGIEGPKDVSPIGFEYTTSAVYPHTMCIVPILRSGLAMVDEVPVHHLGMYREPTTLAPVEYYNNLPNHIHSSAGGGGGAPSSLAIIVDPVIATGGTCAAAITTLREWGAKRVLVLSVIGAREGVVAAAQEWPEGTEIWLAGMDEELTKEGMLKPGLGDVGDRLFLTIGK